MRSACMPALNTAMFRALDLSNILIFMGVTTTHNARIEYYMYVYQVVPWYLPSERRLVHVHSYPSHASGGAWNNRTMVVQGQHIATPSTMLQVHGKDNGNHKVIVIVAKIDLCMDCKLIISRPLSRPNQSQRAC